MNTGVWSIAFCLSALGQGNVGAPLRLAVVNLAEVSEKYQRTIDLESQFETRRAKFNQDRDAMRDKAERLAKATREELKPGTDEFRERAKQVALLEAELKWFVEAEGQKLEEGLKASLRSIFEDVQAVVRELAEEKGFELVVAGDQLPEQPPDSPAQLRQQILFQKVLYWNPRVDITPEVISRLNARYQARGSDASKGGTPPAGADPKAKRDDRPPKPGSRP